MTIDANNAANIVTSLFNAAPLILAYYVLAKVVFTQVKTWKGTIAPTDAAYLMAAVAAFSYVAR